MTPWQRHPKTGHFYTPIERELAFQVIYQVFSQLREDVKSPDDFYTKLEGSVKTFLPFMGISRRMLTARDKGMVKDLTREAQRRLVHADLKITSDVPHLLTLSGEAIADAENHSLADHLPKYENRYRQFFPDGHSPLTGFERTSVNFLSFILGGKDWRQWDLRDGKTSLSDLYFLRGMDELAIGALANAWYRTETFDPETFFRTFGLRK